MAGQNRHPCHVINNSQFILAQNMANGVRLDVSLSPAFLYAEIYINYSNEKITVDKLKGRAFQCEWKVPGWTPGLQSSYTRRIHLSQAKLS